MMRSYFQMGVRRIAHGAVHVRASCGPVNRGVCARLRKVEVTVCHVVAAGSYVAWLADASGRAHVGASCRLASLTSSTAVDESGQECVWAR